MSSRKIEDLALDVQKPCLDFIHDARMMGIDLLITCTYRSSEEQDWLYQQGRTRPGHIVTNAKGGQSLHNHTNGTRPAARAFDIVPVVGGKPYWSTEGKAAALWQQIGLLGERYGFEWAGRWKGPLAEFAHFQKPEGV